MAISFPSSPVAGTSIYQGGRQWTYDGTTWNLVLGGAYELYWTHTGTGGETTLSGASDNGTTLTYPLGGENVYLNGVLLVRGSDYTATTGSTIVLANPLAVSDILTVVSYPAVQMSSNNIAQTTEPTTYTPGMVWVNTAGNTQGLQLVRWKKTPTGGTTVLSGLADDGTTTLAYTAGYEEVYVNGILIVKGVDYTATNGTSITLTQATVTGDTVEVFNTITMGVTNTYTQSQSDARYIPLSQFTAKGDILVGTGSGSETALNVGADGSTLVANSSASTGLSWAGPSVAAGKNFVINGGMDIWQRGTTYTGTYGAVADRFFNGTDSTMTISQQAFTPGNPISGYEPAYYLQIAKSSGGSYTDMAHSIEDVRTLAGQTFTFSFWGRVTSGTIGYGFGFNQNFGTGGSTQVAGPQPAFNLTTTWQRFTYTGAMPSISGKTLGPSSKVQIYGYCGTSAAVTIQLWGLQLEAGSVATPFSRAGGTLQGELAACQRYCYVATNQMAGNTITAGITGGAFYFPVTMRTAPTFTNGSFTASSGSNGTFGASIISTGSYNFYNASGNWSTPGYNIQASFVASAEL